MIEFNPNRPTRRVRFSVAHELAHTLFPDWKERVRERLTHEQMSGSGWQLEMLCNIGAAEILMPTGSFTELRREGPSVETLLKLRDKYDVSTEAIFLRLARLTDYPCFVFSASVKDENAQSLIYRIDYALKSWNWKREIRSGLQLPTKSIVRECVAIGHTAVGHESWSRGLGDVYLECIGIPPYPNCLYPRVIGVGTAGKPKKHAPVAISYLRGDATRPRGEGKRIVAHIVNDQTPNWGRGFGWAVREAWPQVQKQFRDWVERHPTEFKLGKVAVSSVDDVVDVAHLICQRGYGESRRPRIRYGHLASCLEKLADLALERNATVHMPAIGTGEARGSWETVSGLLEEILCRRGVRVTVYLLPGHEIKDTQGSLPLELTIC